MATVVVGGNRLALFVCALSLVCDGDHVYQLENLLCAPSYLPMPPPANISVPLPFTHLPRASMVWGGAVVDLGIAMQETQALHEIEIQV